MERTSEFKQTCIGDPSRKDLGKKTVIEITDKYKNHTGITKSMPYIRAVIFFIFRIVVQYKQIE